MPYDFPKIFVLNNNLNFQKWTEAERRGGAEEGGRVEVGKVG